MGINCITLYQILMSSKNSAWKFYVSVTQIYGTHYIYYMCIWTSQKFILFYSFYFFFNYMQLRNTIFLIALRYEHADDTRRA